MEKNSSKHIISNLAIIGTIIGIDIADNALNIGDYLFTVFGTTAALIAGYIILDICFYKYGVKACLILLIIAHIIYQAVQFL